MFIWTSSRCSLNLNLPDSISEAIALSPFTIIPASFEGMIPCLPSILAWAILPSMSNLQSLLSKETDSEKDSTMADVSLVNLPDQGFFTEIDLLHGAPGTQPFRGSDVLPTKKVTLLYRSARYFSSARPLNLQAMCTSVE